MARSLSILRKKLRKSDFAINFFIVAALLALSACGTDSRHFKIEGRFLHLNQGEFYVYSPTGGVDGIDTLKVQGGRFALEIPLEEPTLLMMVFPNFTQQPIFAEPGASVDIKGDASHLKEMTVKGTDENELMNKFRKSIVSASPPEAKQRAVQFIKDHPQSLVSVYLLTYYVLQGDKPNYDQAAQLIGLMRPKQPKNGYLIRLMEKVEALRKTAADGPLPAFTAYDTNGKPVTDAYIRSAQVAVVSLWTSWNYESVNMQRQLGYLERHYNGRLKLLSLCADGNKSVCLRSMNESQVDWPTVCDGQMFEGKTIRLFGMGNVPDNLVYRQGRLVAQGLTMVDLEKRLKELLGD